MHEGSVRMSFDARMEHQEDADAAKVELAPRASGGAAAHRRLDGWRGGVPNASQP